MGPKVKEWNNPYEKNTETEGGKARFAVGLPPLRY